MNKTHGGNIWKIAKENELRPEDIVDFSASINPLGLSPKAEAAIKNAISFLGHYPEPGAEAIIHELASFHNLPEENILAGNGSSQFIYLIPQIFQPKKALLVEPCFSEYRNSLANSCAIDSFLCREDNGFLPPIDSIGGKLFDEIKKGYDIVYMGNPANPTGALISKKTILGIAAECKKYKTILIIDEAFIDFVEEDSVKQEAVLFDNLIVIRSMTKFFAMPGLRLGYIIAHDKIISEFKDIMPPWSVNTLAIAAGIESLRDKDYITKTREWLASDMPSFMEGLKAVPYVKTYPTKVNYMLVKILFNGIIAADIQKQLLKNGILIRDCGDFIGLGSSFFRLAVREKEENRFLIDCINRMFINR
ncbi:MAG TPA: threonine-phosphate decarboxylase CobD [Thermodesulfobacteriota bacterium]|nr:threonine-phosphate decarboxylase CobD [Thermodesulfobacteriota bacterium]